MPVRFARSRRCASRDCSVFWLADLHSAPCRFGSAHLCHNQIHNGPLYLRRQRLRILQLYSMSPRVITQRCLVFETTLQQVALQNVSAPWLLALYQTK